MKKTLGLIGMSVVVAASLSTVAMAEGSESPAVSTPAATAPATPAPEAPAATAPADR